jgi:hypothetical protein
MGYRHNQSKKVSGFGLETGYWAQENCDRSWKKNGSLCNTEMNHFVEVSFWQLGS